MTNRVLIFANTPWEADALTAVFSNGQARPPTRDEPTRPLFDSYFFPSKLDALPAVDMPGSAKPVYARLAYTNVEVWCVTDLTLGKYGSREKANALKIVADSRSAPKLVVAFGTAAYPDPHIYDGCVVVGSNVFNFDPKVDGLDPADQWIDRSIGSLQDNSKQSINDNIFQQLRGRLRLPIESRFLSPPISGVRAPFLLASASYVAVSDVNVAHVDDYAWADRDAIQALTRDHPRSTPGSVETTHGIIHASVKSDQFLFVSAIANRLGYFNMEVAPRNYAQDFAVAHNAAVALAWLLPQILATLT